MPKMSRKAASTVSFPREGTFVTRSRVYIRRIKPDLVGPVGSGQPTPAFQLPPPPTGQ